MTDILADDAIAEDGILAFHPTGTRLIVKALEPSSSYASRTKGGIFLPSNKDQSAFFRARILSCGPDCELPDDATYVHIMIGGGLKGAKPISMAHGHFACEQEDIWAYETTPFDDVSEPVPENLIQLVTD